MPKFLLLFSFILGQGFPIPKIDYSPRSYVCYKTPAPILLDGKMNDPFWEKVDWSESFVDIEGDLKPLPFYDTKVKMLWDENYFYFGAKMEDPHVWATLTKRDAVIFKDNDFEIFLDPDGDTHHYYELEVNALETEWDLLLLKPYRDQAKVAVDSWDIPGLITKVHVDGTINDPSDIDKGWSVEIAIPWKALEECAPNFHPQEGEQWKINFSRVHWNTKIQNGQYIKTKLPEYNWVWSPQGIIAMHYPEMWGLVQFTETMVGEELVKFQTNELDQIKWSLRQLYYRERSYFESQGHFTTSLKKLEFNETPVAGVPWPPQLSLTPSGWEAFIKMDRQKVFIRRDGKVWFE
ncbi:MAG: carbohydrate-binding family 9-like protein [Candidatus Neomarinimicrobiota bacterium]|nr:carbohydrate-binding family 9-like protein [Candidatus Neomarinimicrobiota bacterium]